MPRAGNIVLAHRLERDAEALDQAGDLRVDGHQNTTFRTPVARMLTSESGMRNFQAKLLELVLAEAGVGEADPEDEERRRS